MKTSEHLYGDRHTELTPIPQELIDQRLGILKEHQSRLLNVHYLERDDKSIKEVDNALSFWKKINEH